MPSKIEWTDETWNPVTGCTKVSEGCRHCYAERMARRLAGRYGYPEVPHHFDVTVHDDRLWHPPIGRKPRRIFVCSMSDIAHPRVSDAILDHCTRYVARRCSDHLWLILTKRPQRLCELWADKEPIPNLWIGVTVENQATIWRIDELMKIPAAVRFVSCEPLLGLLDLRPYLDGDWADSQGCPAEELPFIDWVIVGGESGPGASPMHPDWARSLRDQAQAARVPFFFKQWGAWAHIPSDTKDFPHSAKKHWFDRNLMARVGKKAAGRLLDGREWNEMPALGSDERGSRVV